MQPRTAARALITGSASVAVAMTDSSMLWLQNSTADPIEVGPCELFGYNMGSFNSKKTGRSSLDHCAVSMIMLPLNFMAQFAINFVALFVMCQLKGTAKSQKKGLVPFILEKDTDFMVHVVAGQGKKLIHLSDLACHVAQTNGLTEMSIEDHTVKQVQDRQWKLLCEWCHSNSSCHDNQSNIKYSSSHLLHFQVLTCVTISWSWVVLTSLRHWIEFVRTMPETLCHFVILWRWAQRWRALSPNQFRPPMTSLTVGHLFSVLPFSRGPMASRPCQPLKRASAFGKLLDVIIQGFGIWNGLAIWWSSAPQATHCCATVMNIDFISDKISKRW